jgi:hypothetical protein
MISIDSNLVKNALGTSYESNFAFLLADGTSGGILLAAKDSHLLLQNPSLTNHTISTSVIDSILNVTWMIIGVYGPQGELDKKMFIRELSQLK